MGRGGAETSEPRHREGYGRAAGDVGGGEDSLLNGPDLPTEPIVWDALKTVFDPELGFNLVDLGLIYSVEIAERKVMIRMTLTTRGCPMHESLVWGVRRAVLSLEPVQAVDVQLVWDPPWQPSMMSAAARAQLGVAGAAG